MKKGNFIFFNLENITIEKDLAKGTHATVLSTCATQSNEDKVIFKPFRGIYGLRVPIIRTPPPSSWMEIRMHITCNWKCTMPLKYPVEDAFPNNLSFVLYILKVSSLY